MALRSTFLRPFARHVARGIDRWSADPVGAQAKVLRELLRNGRRTAFGRFHGLDRVRDHTGFRAAVPLRDYEGLRPWVERIKAGEESVLWPGMPKYFAKTSGTTSGVKYIPLTAVRHRKP
jgi:hypothetical protein